MLKPRGRIVGNSCLCKFEQFNAGLNAALAFRLFHALSALSFDPQFLIDQQPQTMLCCAIIRHHEVFDRQKDGGAVRIA